MYHKVAVDYTSVGIIELEGKEIDSDDLSLADFIELNDPDLFAKAKPFLAFTEDVRKKGY